LCLNLLLKRNVITGEAQEVATETDRFEITDANLTVLEALLEWQTSQNKKISHKNITSVLDQLAVLQPKVEQSKVVVIERGEHRDVINGALWNQYWASQGKPQGPGAWGIPLDIAKQVEQFSATSHLEPSKH